MGLSLSLDMIEFPELYPSHPDFSSTSGPLEGLFPLSILWAGSFT